MIDRLELKFLAKEQIRGNIGILFVCYLLVSLITGASAFLVVGPLLVAPPLYAGMIILFLGMARGVRPQIEGLFLGFQNFVKYLVLYLVMGLFVFLWSLLLYVPGVIKALSYSFAPYIMVDNPDMEPMEAIRLSQQMTNGHKMDLFVLYLSFLPWMLLVAVTFGIAGIYVFPYMQATYTNAYLKIRG